MSSIILVPQLFYFPPAIYPGSVARLCRFIHSPSSSLYRVPAFQCPPGFRLSSLLLGRIVYNPAHFDFLSSFHAFVDENCDAEDLTQMQGQLASPRYRFTLSELNTGISRVKLSPVSCIVFFCSCKVDMAKRQCFVSVILSSLLSGPPSDPDVDSECIVGSCGRT